MAVYAFYRSPCRVVFIHDCSGTKLSEPPSCQKRLRFLCSNELHRGQTRVTARTIVAKWWTVLRAGPCASTLLLRSLAAACLCCCASTTMSSNDSIEEEQRGLLATVHPDSQHRLSRSTRWFQLALLTFWRSCHVRPGPLFLAAFLNVHPAFVVQLHLPYVRLADSAALRAQLTSSPLVQHHRSYPL